MFPYPIEAPYEIWLWLAQWFLRRRCLKGVDDDYISYKLTKWAFGWGELKMPAAIWVHKIEGKYKITGQTKEKLGQKFNYYIELKHN